MWRSARPHYSGAGGFPAFFGVGTLKVRFTVRTGDARKGEVREVPDHIGEAYVRLGYAVRLDAPKPVETATAPTVEVEKRSTDFAGQAPTPAPVPRPARRGRPPRR